ncbi:MAG: PilZ domain-containing protein [Spirochaetales bacterium]|nr:PilZ domain-containing protein [Spirochaetales bacterium]
MGDFEDKRRYLRLDCLFKVEFENIENSQQIESLAKNISAGGICVITNEPLPKSTVLFLRFHFPEKPQPFSLKGCVVWSKKVEESTEPGYENGIQFLEVNEEIKQSIESTNVVNLKMKI